MKILYMVDYQWKKLYSFICLSIVKRVLGLNYSQKPIIIVVKGKKFIIPELQPTHIYGVFMRRGNLKKWFTNSWKDTYLEIPMLL